MKGIEEIRRQMALDEKTNIAICPHCGCQAEFVYTNGRAAGTVQDVYYVTGKRAYSTVTDNLRMEMSDVVRCGACGRMRKDLFVDKHDKLAKRDEIR